MPEPLWAPWRLQYIEAANKPEGCIFCDLPSADPASDREHLLLHRGAHAFLMLNAFPYANGHLMVAPYQHASSLQAYPDPVLTEVMSLTRLATSLLTIACAPDGFNCGINVGRAAGAGIEQHLHWHIVPRWSGDTNFMPVLADVRVIPQSLDAAWQRLNTLLPQALKGNDAT
ncbi:MAG: HIT domain-containing protein [Armatimonadetes bacterium]|nr:HIT domain-containing protein [Armatimonadota bacterium]MDE2205181.1 HIT domain-containing protein [Armatimonadota bacterium]